MIQCTLKIKVLCFGITREILGGFEQEIPLENDHTVANLKSTLYKLFPDLKKLNSLRIAVNEDYADDSTLLTEKDEVVLIPPVSGG